jgi:hypothetical protein
MTSVILLALLSSGDAAGSCDMVVQRRGDQAMGFSHARTSHHFVLTKDGGTISADANDPGDASSRDAIRSHMRHIASAFAAGDFEMPMFIHGRTPPGIPTMKRLQREISFLTEETERGARVVVRTRNQNALEAVHEFLRFQIADHATGDSVEVR